MVTAIRSEQVEDAAAIREVVARAFEGGAAEVAVVDRLRDSGQLVVSLVAESAHGLTGHVAVSPITLDPDPGLRCVAIGPLGVVPEVQRRGVGTALMRAALERCCSDGCDAVFLLGDPAYYQRFGFVPTTIGNEYGARNAFQVLELREGCLVGIEATARYPDAFGEVGA